MARAFEAVDASVPVRVYARPLVLRPGDRASPGPIRAQLERLGYRATGDPDPAIGEFRLSAREWRIGRRTLRLGAWFDPALPVVVRLDRLGRIASIRDAGDVELAGLLLDPEPLAVIDPPGGRDRVPVRLDELPPHLIDAVLTIEDRRFFEHPGFDLRRIAGALVADLRAGRIVQGGSTITQQLARTVFLGPDRTLLRKVRELAIAVALERRYSKARLLEAYLNHVYLGQLRGVAIHGVGRASRLFFGKDAADLGPGESATLAGIIRGPILYSPARSPERARARRDLVLRLMADRGHLRRETAAEEAGRPLRVRSMPSPHPGLRWYLDGIEARVAAAPGAARPTDVVGTLDPRLQILAERAVRAGVARLERVRPRLAGGGEPLQAALVALDPRTGEILALVGGRSYGPSQFNRATDARRQPGSAFKPIVVAAALVSRGEGAAFTLASTLDDAPLAVRTPGGTWSPRNADGRFLGSVTLREAMEQSRNVPFARLGLEIGPERIIDMGRALGIGSPLAPVPSLSLGASEVSLVELTAAYGVFAAGGERMPPSGIRATFDRNGRRLDRERATAPRRVLSAAEAYLVTSALEGVIERGTGRAVREAGYLGPVAGKSGTTNGYRDAWFVGYTPEMAVGVWVGFDDGRAVGLSGSQAALPIFAAFLREALGPEGGDGFPEPEGVEWSGVPDPASGARGHCGGRPEVFLAGTAPPSCGGWQGRVERWGRSFARGLGRTVRAWLDR